LEKVWENDLLGSVYWSGRPSVILKDVSGRGGKAQRGARPTHSPILMALPGARVLQMTRFGLEETDFRQTRHFRQYRDFCEDPRAFVQLALQERRAD
jgi:predicted ATPase